MALIRISEPTERSGVAATTLRYPAGQAARLSGALDPVKEK